MNALWEMPLKITGGDEAPLSAGMDEAIAMVFAGAPTYEAALTKGVSAIQQMGYVFQDLLGGQVFQVPLDQWDEYVSHKYDYFLENMPHSASLPNLVMSGEVFLGPFLGYNAEAF